MVLVVGTPINDVSITQNWISWSCPDCRDFSPSRVHAHLAKGQAEFDSIWLDTWHWSIYQEFLKHLLFHLMFFACNFRAMNHQPSPPQRVRFRFSRKKHLGPQRCLVFRATRCLLLWRIWWSRWTSIKKATDSYPLVEIIGKSSTKMVVFQGELWGSHGG